jgi:hypothetical protein
MPFSLEMNPIYSVLCKVANELGLTIKRADEFSSSNPIVSDIWSAIWNTKIVIADCTGKNPNVFYEIGIAHTVGKSVVFLTQDKMDIPFDISHIRYLEYQPNESGLIDLAELLEDVLIHCLQLYDY